MKYSLFAAAALALAVATGAQAQVTGGTGTSTQNTGGFGTPFGGVGGFGTGFNNSGFGANPNTGGFGLNNGGYGFNTFAPTGTGFNNGFGFNNGQGFNNGFGFNNGQGFNNGFGFNNGQGTFGTGFNNNGFGFNGGFGNPTAVSGNAIVQPGYGYGGGYYGGGYYGYPGYGYSGPVGASAYGFSPLGPGNMPPTMPGAMRGGVPTLGLNVSSARIPGRPSRRVIPTRISTPDLTGSIPVGATDADSGNSGALRGDASNARTRGADLSPEFQFGGDDEQPGLTRRVSQIMQDRPLRQGELLQVGATQARVRWETNNQVQTFTVPVDEVFMFGAQGRMTALADNSAMGRPGMRVLFAQPMQPIRQSVAGSRQELSSGTAKRSTAKKSTARRGVTTRRK